MIDITDKQKRKELIIRYLEAETSLAEETLLADYFTSHKADADEADIAQLIRIEASHAGILSSKGVAEFDSIIQKSKAKRTIASLKYWISGIAAIMVLFFSIKLFHSQGNTSDTIEIAHEIQQIMNLNTNDIMSVTATPMNGGVWITVELADGTTKTFIRTKDMDKTSLLAIL